MMGDSIIEAWGELSFANPEEIEVINRGISGQTTFQILLRFQEDVVALDPDIVILLMGTNDIAGNAGDVELKWIEANIRMMVELAQANSIVPVLSSILPVESYYWREDRRPMEDVLKLNEWLEDFAVLHDLMYVNYYPLLVGEKGEFATNLTRDGVHPNRAGYAVMNAFLKEQIVALEISKSKHSKHNEP